MSIDIKTLRIGSHVEYEGERVCVGEISTLRSKDAPMRLIVSRNRLVYGYPSIDEIEPIPITSELLKMLGFEDCSNKLWHTEDYEKCSEERYLSFTGFHRGWRVYYFDGAVDRGRTIIRYLHEAEAFLACMVLN